MDQIDPRLLIYLMVFAVVYLIALGREDSWSKNPGKVFAYFALGLLFWSWFADLGSIEFRAIFLAVTILIVAGLTYAYWDELGKEPFWPENPAILPIRAVQGLGLAVVYLFGWIAVSFVWALLFVAAGTVVGGVIYLLMNI